MRMLAGYTQRHTKTQKSNARNPCRRRLIIMAKRREDFGVKAGDQIVVRGTVSFARLDKLVEGEALEKENARRTRNGGMTTKPFRSITIENPEFVQGAGSPLAQYHESKAYVNKKTGAPTLSLESKSLFPPKYGHIQEDGTLLEMDDPKKNPAIGQVVYLLIKAFAPKAQGAFNLGSSFESIAFEKGPINFYEGSSNSLEGFGEALGMKVVPMAPQAPNADQGAQTNQGGFGAAPTADPNQGQNGFGAVPNQENQTGFGQQNQGGFGGQQQGVGFGQTQTEQQQQPQQDQNQAGANPFGSQNANPFGNQNQGSPFGSGQPNNNPFG